MIIPPERLDGEQLKVFNELREQVKRLYMNEDAYESAIEEILAFSRGLFLAYGKQTVRRTILFQLLLGSSMPEDADPSTHPFDIEGRDSIAEFIRSLARKYLKE